MKNRFRIKKDETVIEKASTMQEVVSILKKQEYEYESLYVECLVDEIEISGDEIIEAFGRGERPEDLQFF